MPWIEQIPVEKATGLLKSEFEYFNYITRVADALGVEPEDFIRPWGQLESHEQHSKVEA